MLTREIADRLIQEFETMSEADRDALLKRAGVQNLTAIDENGHGSTGSKKDTDDSE